LFGSQEEDIFVQTPTSFQKGQVGPSSRILLLSELDTGSNIQHRSF